MKRIIIMAALLALFQTAVEAQSLRLGVEGGALTVLNPDEFKNSAPEGFGMKNGLSFGIKAKYDPPASPFRLTGNINYSSFSAEETYSTYTTAILRWPFEKEPYIGLEKGTPEKTTDVSPGDMLAITSAFIISIGAGAEWKIVDWKASPYLAGGLFLNYYKTEDEETGLHDGFSAKYEDSGTRLGGFLGAGAEIKMLARLNLDVFAKYNLYDLMSSSDMEGFAGEANNGFSAMYLGAALQWSVF